MNGTELEVREVEAVALFPQTGGELIVAAKAVADPLAKLIKDRDLYTMVHGKAHVHLEGWQTLGAMVPVGIVALIVGEPIPIYKDTEDEKGKLWGYRVCAEAKTFDGKVVGRAWSECTRDESSKGKPWPKAAPHALLGMAQTRAMGRALKGPLGWIMKLAGYSATPAEEMDQFARVVDGGESASPDFGEDPELADKLAAAFRAAKAKDAAAWSDAKLRATLAGCETDADREELLAEILEWLEENGVDGGF